MPGIACPVCQRENISFSQRATHLLVREPLTCSDCGALLSLKRREKILTIPRGAFFQVIVLGGVTLGLYFESWMVLLQSALLLFIANLLFEVTGTLGTGDEHRN